MRRAPSSSSPSSSWLVASSSPRAAPRSCRAAPPRARWLRLAGLEQSAGRLVAASSNLRGDRWPGSRVPRGVLRRSSSDLGVGSSLRSRVLRDLEQSAGRGVGSSQAVRRQRPRRLEQAAGRLVHATFALEQAAASPPPRGSRACAAGSCVSACVTGLLVEDPALAALARAPRRVSGFAACPRVPSHGCLRVPSRATPPAARAGAPRSRAARRSRARREPNEASRRRHRRRRARSTRRACHQLPGER